LEGAPQKNFGGEKHAKFGPISNDFEVQQRISPKWMNIFKIGIFIPSTAIPPALGETSPVKFGPVTLEISMLNRTHQSAFFGRTYFGP